MRTEYNKLIRDKIPDIIEKSGKVFKIEQYDDEAYKEALLDKLVEEAIEVKNSSNNHIMNELADLLEVYETIIDIFDLSDQEIMSLKEKRFEERGGFLDRLRLLWVDDKEKLG